MGNISRRFQQIVIKTQKKFLDQGTIMPVQTEQGILVGNALIVCDGPYKNLYCNGELIFENVCLNKVAIRLANMIAWNKLNKLAFDIFNADRNYNRYHVDSTITLASYHVCLQSKDYFKADVLWARYCEAKAHAKSAKEKAERLASF